MRRLILCADDFALSRPISETIVRLALADKINAVSCMAICRGWAEDAALLVLVPDTVEVGLHLTLTDEPPLTAMPRFAPDGAMPAVDPLTCAAYLGTIPIGEIATEIEAQFHRFVRHFGHAPAFVDGHQHVHVLPSIRSLVLDATRRWAPGAWIRNCTDRAGAIAMRPFRAKAIGSALHASGLARAAASHGLRCNDGFAGHYDFTSNYADLFPRFLAYPGHHHLVMCHPGDGMQPGDGIAAARMMEAGVLQSLPVRELAAVHGLAFP